MDEFRRAVDELTAAANEDVTRTAATQTWVSTLLVGAIVIALLCVAGLAALLLKDMRRHFELLETREITARQLAGELDLRVALRTRELAEANQRFEAALRASGVTLMTQDRDLVFTWVSRGIFGQAAQAIVGRPQQDVNPEATPGAATNLKRAVLETGEPARGDIRFTHEGGETWYDLTVHPLTDEYGVITGIIAGAVDITRYKEQEARIRLLMREVTHRSKNLLTVIQAIMRQTATNSGSIADFETRFSARLQSLAGSHDLLVQEDWQGASMRELVRSQLGHYIDRVGSQIELTGDSLQIRTEMPRSTSAWRCTNWRPMRRSTGRCRRRLGRCVSPGWCRERRMVKRCAPLRGRKPAAHRWSDRRAGDSAGWSSNAPSRARSMARFASITRPPDCAGRWNFRWRDPPGAGACGGHGTNSAMTSLCQRFPCAFDESGAFRKGRVSEGQDDF